MLSKIHIFCIVCILVGISCIIIFSSTNIRNKYNIQEYNQPAKVIPGKIKGYNANFTDTDIKSLNKCLYLNNLAINSNYIVNYFTKTKNNWYVNNNIATQILSELLIFSNDSSLYKDSNYTKISGKYSQLNNNTTVQYVNSVLEFSPDINSIDNIEKTVEQPKPIVQSWKEVIKNKLIAQNYGTVFENYTQISYIKNQIYNIIKNGTDAIETIYTDMFTDYINNKYTAFVIYIDYLHYNSIEDINGIVSIIRPIYNIIKNIQNIKKIQTLPVNFIIELPRTINEDEMSNKINSVMSDNALNTNINPTDKNSPIIRNLILGFNIVPGIEDNNDISYYKDVWNNYIIKPNNFRFYFDVGNCGQEKIIDNDNITEIIPLNPYSITNAHNIVSNPYIIDIINNDQETINSILENNEDNEDINFNFNNISLNITPITDSIIGHPNITQFILINCDKNKINVAPTILPLFDKTLIDVYTSPDLSIFSKDDVSNSIINTYKNITGQLLL